MTPPIFRFGPLRCKWAFNLRVKLDFCQRRCKLLGVAVCPRALTLGETIQMDFDKMGAKKSG